MIVASCECCPLTLIFPTWKEFLHDLAIFKEHWNLLLRVFLFGAMRLSRFDFLAFAEAPSSTLPAFLKGSCQWEDFSSTKRSGSRRCISSPPSTWSLNSLQNSAACFFWSRCLLRCSSWADGPCPPLYAPRRYPSSRLFSLMLSATSSLQAWIKVRLSDLTSWYDAIASDGPLPNCSLLH